MPNHLDEQIGKRILDDIVFLDDTRLGNPDFLTIGERLCPRGREDRGHRASRVLMISRE
jgi:hypothetical protein